LSTSEVGHLDSEEQLGAFTQHSLTEHLEDAQCIREAFALKTVPEEHLATAAKVAKVAKVSKVEQFAPETWAGTQHSSVRHTAVEQVVLEALLRSTWCAGQLDKDEQFGAETWAGTQHSSVWHTAVEQVVLEALLRSTWCVGQLDKDEQFGAARQQSTVQL
jgi:hypothetical protein